MRRVTTPMRLAAEFLGTAVLLSAVVGSGIVTATGGAASTQLFQHAVVVGAALVVLILVFGPVSGAHLNPAVTVADWWFGGLPTRRAAAYVAVQVAGALAGTVATHLTFGLGPAALGTTARDGPGMVAGEALATAGLLVVIFALVHTGRGAAVPGAVGAWIGAGIFFGASASFANPAVTLARAVTDTWTGIRPGSVPTFLAGQALGVAVAIPMIGWLYDPSGSQAHEIVVPHDDAAVIPPLSAATTDGPVPARTRRRRRNRWVIHDDPSFPALPTVLFLCVHNAGRSQMASGWMQHLAGDRVDVRSAGSEPASQVNPAAVEAMAEVGINITDNVPRPWRADDVDVADVIVTMGCGDTCPVLPGRRHLDWELQDPAGKGVEQVRPIRDEIERRVRVLLADLGVDPDTGAAHTRWC